MTDENVDLAQAVDPGWGDVCKELRASVGSDAFTRWFRTAAWGGKEDGIGTVTVPGEMHQVWIESNYLPELRVAVNRVFDEVREVNVVVAESPSQSIPVLHQSGSSRSHPRNKPATLEGEALQRRIKSAGLNEAYTFDRFVVGDNSQFAHAACQAVASKSRVGYNPLFIHGRPGLGKTHLMQAIGHEILRRQPGARVIYLTGETFTNEFIDALRRGDLEKFRRRYRNSDVLLIDDVQFIANKEKTQEEFFHTFNTLFDGRNRVVLTSDRPACDIKNLEPRLVSRFECGLTVETIAPELETRLAILRKKCADWKLRLDEWILLFLAEKIRTNVRRLEGALFRVASFASLSRESLTAEKLGQMISDLIREDSSRQITIDAIQKGVAEHYDVRLADMTSRRRPASIAFPRQVAMYLSRSLTKGSLMEIGEAFGGRDHGTVIHACKKVSEQLGQDEALRAVVARIEAQLKH